MAEAARAATPSSPSLSAALDAAARANKGLRGVALAFADFSGADRTPELALVEVALQWRNRLVHSGSNARINGDLQDRLHQHAADLQNNYRHLDPGQMIARFASREESPSLKEVTGMITAAHRFVSSVDSAVLPLLDYGSLLDAVIRQHLDEVPRVEGLKRANRIWGRGEPRARRAIVTLARQNGFAEPRDGIAHGLTDASIDRLACMSSRQATAAFLPA